MGKVTLNPLVAPDSQIYSQPISIGVRFTKFPARHLLDGVDLLNPPSDTAIDVAKNSMNLIKPQA